MYLAYTSSGPLMYPSCTRQAILGVTALRKAALGRRRAIASPV